MTSGLIYSWLVQRLRPLPARTHALMNIHTRECIHTRTRLLTQSLTLTCARARTHMPARPRIHACFSAMFCHRAHQDTHLDKGKDLPEPGQHRRLAGI